MGISSPSTLTTPASSEEASGESEEDDSYWNIVYDAIVWIDAFTVF